MGGLIAIADHRDEIRAGRQVLERELPHASRENGGPRHDALRTDLMQPDARARERIAGLLIEQDPLDRAGMQASREQQHG